jgi:energy-converting hydrogenase B subunit Q
MSGADSMDEGQETPAAKPGAAGHHAPMNLEAPVAASTDRASETESLTVDEQLADRFVDPKSIGLHDDGVIALLVRVRVPDQPGVLYTLTRVIFEHRANIIYVDISERRAQGIATYFELSDVEDLDQLVAGLEALPIVKVVEREPSFGRIYGKRIIVIGGGAQVGQVVLGAVTEADRHNIRGERISVDTIPLVGEEDLAGAVRAVARLPRAVALVMAGSIMGGEVALAVREVRQQGIIVVSLNMAGSVPEEADLVVTDPVQAGVMTVMAVARTAKFDIRRQIGRRY